MALPAVLVVPVLIALPGIQPFLAQGLRIAWKHLRHVCAIVELSEISIIFGDLLAGCFAPTRVAGKC